MQFRPTHRIELASGAVYEVKLVDGAAYDRTEWEQHEKADFERGEDGWTLQGEPFDGTVTPLPNQGQINLAHQWLATDPQSSLEDVARLGLDAAAVYHRDLVEQAAESGDHRWDSLREEGGEDALRDALAALAASAR